MARVARGRSSTGIYHVMFRGINRQTIFEDEEDRIQFLDTLRNYKEISQYKVYGYCLMDNHVHLLLEEVEEEISQSIKRICSSYVYWYNSKHGRCGHLFQERFKSEAVENNSYFLTVLRYIHQNPLKAKMVKSVKESKWTSYKEYAEKESFIDVDLALNSFSTDRAKAISIFIEFMNANNDDQCLDDEEKVKLSDDEVRQQMRRLGIENISKFQQLDKAGRDLILAELKKVEGISSRQLARVTGVSKSVINRAR